MSNFHTIKQYQYEDEYKKREINYKVSNENAIYFVVPNNTVSTSCVLIDSGYSVGLTNNKGSTFKCWISFEPGCYQFPSEVFENPSFKQKPDYFYEILFKF